METKKNITDATLKAAIREGHFEHLNIDGHGLFLQYRKTFSSAVFKFRFRDRDGFTRVISLGRYPDDRSLADARKVAREFRAGIVLGSYPQTSLRTKPIPIDDPAPVMTVSMLGASFFDRHVKDRVKHPALVSVRQREIDAYIGHIPVAKVTPRHIDEILKDVSKRSPTAANKVLRLLQRIFRFAVRLGEIQHSPAALFEISDAGGTERPRDRALSRDELRVLFATMPTTPACGRLNEIALTLLLMLCVRKTELTEALIAEFLIDDADPAWILPAERTKPGRTTRIPLPPQAVALIREAISMSWDGIHLLPARVSKGGIATAINPSTLNVALGKIQAGMPDVLPFTIHDLRRTSRSILSSVAPPHVCEAALNHAPKGLLRVYDQHDYLYERRRALCDLADILESLMPPKRALPVEI